MPSRPVPCSRHHCDGLAQPLSARDGGGQPSSPRSRSSRGSRTGGSPARSGLAPRCTRSGRRSDDAGDLPRDAASVAGSPEPRFTGPSPGPADERDEGGRQIADVEEVADLGAARHLGRTAREQGVHDRGHEPGRMLARAVDEEDPPPRPRAARALEVTAEGVLRAAVPRRRCDPRRRLVVDAVGRPVVLGTGAGADDPLTARRHERVDEPTLASSQRSFSGDSQKSRASPPTRGAGVRRPDAAERRRRRAPAASRSASCQVTPGTSTRRPRVVACVSNPAATSSGRACRPMKPDPPVTRTRLTRLIVGRPRSRSETIGSEAATDADGGVVVADAPAAPGTYGTEMA